MTDNEGTFRDLMKEFPGSVIIGPSGSGKSLIPFGREQLYGAGRRKEPPASETERPLELPDDPPAVPEDDPFAIPPEGWDPNTGHEDPDDGLAKPEDAPPPPPKTILELGGVHG